MKDAWVPRVSISSPSILNVHLSDRPVTVTNKFGYADDLDLAYGDKR